MNTLFLDCSSGMNIVLICGDKSFSMCDFESKKHTEDLLVQIDDILNKAKIKVSEIDNFVVCVGPGSFTGIRVAVSTLKGLAVNFDCKIFELSNFDLYEKKENSILVLEAFSKFLYIRIFENDKYTDKCLDVSELSKLKDFQKFDIYVENEKVQNMLNNYEISSKIAKINIKNAIFDCLKNNNAIELNQISPVYLRLSQAEIERNKKLCGDENA